MKPAAGIGDMDQITNWIAENSIYVISIGVALILTVLFVIFIVIKRRNVRRRRSDYPDYDAMDGQDFELWCAQLLADNGFDNVRVTKGSGDQGVDILAEKDDVRFAIQCKLYSSPLGNKPIQEVFTGKTIYNCHVGVVMTNSVFTSGAREAAEKTGVILWDAGKLEELMQH